MCLTLEFLLFACLLHGNIDNALVPERCYNLIAHVDPKIYVCFFFSLIITLHPIGPIEVAAKSNGPLKNSHDDMCGLSGACCRRLRVS